MPSQEALQAASARKGFIMQLIQRTLCSSVGTNWETTGYTDSWVAYCTLISVVIIQSYKLIRKYENIFVIFCCILIHRFL